MSHVRQVRPGKQHLYRWRGQWRLDDPTLYYSAVVDTVKHAIEKGAFWRPEFGKALTKTN